MRIKRQYVTKPNVTRRNLTRNRIIQLHREKRFWSRHKAMIKSFMVNRDLDNIN